MKFLCSVLVVVVTLYFNYVSTTDLKAFDDTVLFKVNWPGRDGNELFVSISCLLLLFIAFVRYAT